MDSIPARGFKIMNTHSMKQSGLVRFEVELNENDSKEFGGIIFAHQTHNMVFNADFVPTEIEGNDNGTTIGKLAGPDQYESCNQCKGIAGPGHIHADPL